MRRYVEKGFILIVLFKSGAFGGAPNFWGWLFLIAIIFVCSFFRFIAVIIAILGFVFLIIGFIIL